MSHGLERLKSPLQKLPRVYAGDSVESHSWFSWGELKLESGTVLTLMVNSRVNIKSLTRERMEIDLVSGAVRISAAKDDAMEFVVVHDQAFYDALPEGVTKTFLPTTDIDRYTQTLASCDIALLPLNDTPFNRCKSDLKLIECAAAQVAVICSDVVYAKNKQHKKFASFANTSDEWRDALLTLASDAKLRKSKVTKGLAYVKKERMHAQQSASRLAFYQSLLSNRNTLASQRTERLSALAAGR